MPTRTAVDLNNPSSTTPIDVPTPMPPPGKKLIVYAVRPPRGNEGGSIWVKAGTAWVNRDGSINVYLDVLPLDGKLCIRDDAR